MLTGYAGAKTYPKGEIARRLKISPAAVSQRINKISSMLEEGLNLDRHECGMLKTQVENTIKQATGRGDQQVEIDDEQYRNPDGSSLLRGYRWFGRDGTRSTLMLGTIRGVSRGNGRSSDIS